MNWYFQMHSQEYGIESFGPYELYQDALAGMQNVLSEVLRRTDTMEREFTGPFQQLGEEE